MPNLLAKNQLDPDIFELYVTERLEYIIHEPHNFIKSRHVNFLIGFKGKSTYVKLVDKVQLDIVSFVRLDTEIHFGVEYQVIKLSYSKFPQRGYVRYVFSILLFDFRYYIMSDSLHTIPGSMNFWKKIRKLEGCECRILNISTKWNRLYKNQQDNAIWGLDDEYFVNGKLDSRLVEDFFSGEVINRDLYDYIVTNQKKISNKEYLRLFIRVLNNNS